MPLDIDGNLFDLATSLAGLLDAPVTIEDHDTIVIAFSGGNQDVDAARIGTILGRQVPLRYRDAIAATGVLDHLKVSDDVFIVDLPEEQMVPRAVVAVRDQGQLVGSIWAAIPEGPSPSQVVSLVAAAPQVAKLLRAERDMADRGRRERTQLVTTLLAGGAAAEQVATDHALSGQWVAVSLRGVAAETARAGLGPLTLHLSAVAPSALCAAHDRGILGVLAADSARRILDDFLRRFSGRDQLVVGIGTPGEAVDLAESRAVADQVADALLRRDRTGVVATLEDVFADVLVDRLDGFLNRHGGLSPLARLREHDRRFDAGLVDAVRALLDTGEVSAAAEALVVHPNTVRNRLRKAREQCGVDIGDPATRLALMVDLRSVR